MQQDEHATSLKHENKIHGSDVHKMVDKTLALSHRQIHPLKGSNKHGKNAFGKQISDLVKLTLVWNFRSDITIWSNKTICYRT